MTRTLTAEEVQAHVGGSGPAQTVELASLSKERHLACIDGRDEHGVVGTPGGEAGEFLLALAALEQVAGKDIDEAAVERALRRHVAAFGDFYLHTDAHAVQGLLAAGRTDERLQPAFAGIDDLEVLGELLRHPPGALHEALLEQVVKPEHLGCGHIRLMLTQGEDYGIRPELVTAFLRAFHRLLWEGAREPTLVMLHGNHEEAAVLVVHSAVGGADPAPVPLVTPCSAGTQVFVNHADVAHERRGRVAALLSGAGGPLLLGSEQVEALPAAIDALGARQLGHTVRQLAAGLPIYGVVFDAEGGFDVHAS